MDNILVGITEEKKKDYLLLAMANRHGLVAGATGTGKTITLQTIAEQLSRAGVAVLLSDVKGDLSGLAQAGLNKDNIVKRFATLNIPLPKAEASPVEFWDLYAESGHPLRTTLSALGPLLLGRLLDANPVQQGIVDAAFSLADDRGLLLLDLKDFRAVLSWMSEHAGELKNQYGNISSTSIGALQRNLLSLTEAGGEHFFAEPALKITDLLRQNAQGRGIINILDARKLINDPRLYCTFLLWLLSELFEQLPEVGDIDKPKLVFFFDEAHLLFKSAPKILLDKIDQVVRLVRSKGVGVYFVTQSPLDIPENVLGQLGNRVQHGLRAFTPKDQKAVKTAAATFRQNPKLDSEKVITELGVGEALASFLDIKGIPSQVEKIQVLPPVSKIGLLAEVDRAQLVKSSPLYGVYEQTTDRESAYELLSRTDQKQPTPTSPAKPTGRKSTSMTEEIIKTTLGTLNSRIGKQIVRGILGSILGKKK